MKTKTYTAYIEPEPVAACDCDICRYRRASRRVTELLNRTLANDTYTTTAAESVELEMDEQINFEMEWPRTVNF